MTDITIHADFVNIEEDTHRKDLKVVLEDINPREIIEEIGTRDILDEIDLPDILEYLEYEHKDNGNLIKFCLNMLTEDQVLEHFNLGFVRLWKHLEREKTNE